MCQQDARWLGGGLFCCLPICFPFLSFSTGDACHGRLVQILGKMLTSFTAKHFISHINLKLRFVLLCHFMLSFSELNFVVLLSSLTAETCWLSLKQFDDFWCTSPRLGCCKRAADGMTSPPQDLPERAPCVFRTVVRLFGNTFCVKFECFRSQDCK